MSRFDLGPAKDDGIGEWVQCPHCDATGKQEGPGGLEECRHCHGRGERWFEDKDDAELDRS